MFFGILVVYICITTMEVIMNNLNSVLVEGNLTKDPQEKIIEGTSLSSFSIACNRYYKKDGEQTKETSFFDVSVWGKTAEYCNKYLKKGNGVRVVGRLKQEHWVDAEGKNKYAVKIIGEHVDFFPSQKNKSTQDTGDSSEGELPSKETIAIG